MMKIRGDLPKNKLLVFLKKAEAGSHKTNELRERIKVIGHQLFMRKN